MIKLHNSPAEEIPPTKIAPEPEVSKFPDKALKQKMNEAPDLSDPIIKQESSPIGFDDSTRPDFKWSDATHILKDLSLSYVVLGDYVVIMNDHEDVTFSGEPYIALQLWFNTKTGKVLNHSCKAM